MQYMRVVRECPVCLLAEAAGAPFYFMLRLLTNLYIRALCQVLRVNKEWFNNIYILDK
jgi:hypothetical protein